MNSKTGFDIHPAIHFIGSLMSIVSTLGAGVDVGVVVL